MPTLFDLDEIEVPLPSRSAPKARGHAMAPGTGPSGETCKTCRHLVRVQHAKVYLKCELTRERWTGGHATDVRARDSACAKWEGARG